MSGQSYTNNIYVTLACTNLKSMGFLKYLNVNKEIMFASNRMKKSSEEFILQELFCAIICKFDDDRNETKCNRGSSKTWSCNI